MRTWHTWFPRHGGGGGGSGGGIYLGKDDEDEPELVNVERVQAAELLCHVSGSGLRRYYYLCREGGGRMDQNLPSVQPSAGNISQPESAPARRGRTQRTLQTSRLPLCSRQS